MADVSSIWDFLVGGGGLLAGGGGSFAGMRLYLRSLTAKAQDAADKAKVADEKAEQAGQKADKALTKIEIINSRCADHQSHQAEAIGRLEVALQEGFRHLGDKLDEQRREWQGAINRVDQRVDRLGNRTGS